jgi:hypothetical protein
MSLFVVTVESVAGCEVLGAYLNEKDAKVASADYVSKQENVSFKKKQIKKDDTSSKKLLFLEDSKEVEKKSVFVSSVPFELPALKGKGKAKRDPNAPKKGMSAFMLFSNDHRNKIKAENPEATFGEIGRKLGEAWKKLSDKQKAVYTKKAEADKQRYNAEMETYTSGATEAQA